MKRLYLGTLARLAGAAFLASWLAWPAVAQQSQGATFSVPEEPPSDRARVRVVSNGFPQDIYVNDIKIGKIDADETMVFDVQPGEYSFAWRSSDPRVVIRTVEPKRVALVGGQSVNLLPVGAGETSAMIIIVLIHKSTNSGSSSRKIVRPQNCPPVICV